MKKDGESIARGIKLKVLREKAGLTQEKLADILEITGAAWRQYELGVRTPNDKIKKRIAVYFNKTVDELFFSEFIPVKIEPAKKIGIGPTAINFIPTNGSWDGKVLKINEIKTTCIKIVGIYKVFVAKSWGGNGMGDIRDYYVVNTTTGEIQWFNGQVTFSENKVAHIVKYLTEGRSL